MTASDAETPAWLLELARMKMATDSWATAWIPELARLITGLILAGVVFLVVVRPAFRYFMASRAVVDEGDRDGPPLLTDGLDGTAATGGARDQMRQAGQASAVPVTGPTSGPSLPAPQSAPQSVSKPAPQPVEEPRPLPALTAPRDSEQQQLNLDAIRQLVRDDPGVVAQVTKTWLTEDGD